MPAPPARIRSTSVPCGTSSSVLWPALICRSASDTTPGRAEKHVTSRPIWWLSASRCAVGNPGWPSPLQYTLSPVGPRSRSAVMSVDGYRCDTPNPATPRLAPSAMSATASAADITLLIARGPSEFIQSEPGVLDDPAGDDDGSTAAPSPRPRGRSRPAARAWPAPG